MMEQNPQPRYLICVNNDAYLVSLERRKVYEALPDAAALALGLVRVVDETGEDYLFPQELFVPIELPPAAQTLFAEAS